MVGRVRAGRDLTPRAWPDGVRVAVGLSFDLAFEERGLFILTMHPCVIGHRSRIATLGRLIDHRQAMPGVWFAPHEQNARHEKAAAGGLSRD